MLAVIFSPGIFSPVSNWQQVVQQIELLNWVNHQNQLFASGQILSAIAVIGHSGGTASVVHIWTNLNRAK